MLLLGAIFIGIENSYDEKKSFIIEKEIPYSVEKIFPQFDNFQNFVRWNHQFSSDKKYYFTYFSPYEGQGSAMKYAEVKDKSDFGEIFIRYANPNKTIKYEIYENGDETPYKVDVKFISKGEKTKMIWYVETPKISLFQRFLGWVNEENMEEKVSESLKNLTRVLSGKVEREVMLGQIKYDSIMIEEQEERLLLGINVSTNNQKGNLFKNININHNKLIGFVTKDLAKREDEFGHPMLLTEAGGLKNKEISYFYGVPLSKQEHISDNNFLFKKVEQSQIYSIYYKGRYEQRISAINKLLHQIKKDSLKNGMLEELFVEFPNEDREVILKISLPVKKQPQSSIKVEGL